MQTADLDKNYEALGSLFRQALADAASDASGASSFEVSEALEPLHALLDDEAFGRFAEAFFARMDDEGPAALAASTDAMAAAVAIHGAFGAVPNYPADPFRGGWTARAASPFGELVVRDGRVLAQKRQSASESRLVVERLGWILGLQISRSPNGYVSAFACAYGTGPAARSAALAWIAAGRPMASHAPEGFLV